MKNFIASYELSQTHKLEICFDYSPAQPGCHTQRNGDPGWPDEPEEITITDVQVWERKDKDSPWLSIKLSLPEEITNNDFLTEKCSEYLDSLSAYQGEYENDE